MMRDFAYEHATVEQIADTPNGTTAHRNFACPALDDERNEWAPELMRLRAGNLVPILPTWDGE